MQGGGHHGHGGSKQGGISGGGGGGGGGRGNPSGGFYNAYGPYYANSAGVRGYGPAACTIEIREDELKNSMNFLMQVQLWNFNRSDLHKVCAR